METSINIKSVTSANKKVTKSLSNINPYVGNIALTKAASLFTAITNNSYAGGDRINKIELSESYEPTQKNEPTLTVSNDGTITYNGDGQLFGRITNSAEYIFLKIYNNKLSAKNDAGSAPTSFSGEIYASEGTNYTAKSTTFTVGG